MTVSVRSLPIRPTAKPPGYLMARIARGVFFLAPKRLRVFEEIVAYSRSYAPAVLGKIIKVWRGG